MDLREVGYDDRDWINLAQDRDRWWAYRHELYHRLHFKCRFSSGKPPCLGKQCVPLMQYGAQCHSRPRPQGIVAVPYRPSSGLERTSLRPKEDDSPSSSSCIISLGGPKLTSRLLASRSHAEAEVDDEPTRMDVSCA
ncbi:hypothetical protein ANN_26981 [Periplaneta americana]|uniref:Uncharacterized protein n=1 Tax=Periplaneta americana TaxID=6978 RepID=A0ABQ8RWZ6_PERAM|nr:hypothetical protein ANN_26981 [Periplaneta americana]